LLTYRIRNPSAPAEEESSESGVLSKEFILSRQLKKCQFNIGDRVRFKSAKRGKAVAGIVKEITKDPNEINWINGGKTPLNILILVPKPDGENFHRVWVNMKKIVRA